MLPSPNNIPLNISDISKFYSVKVTNNEGSIIDEEIFVSAYSYTYSVLKSYPPENNSYIAAKAMTYFSENLKEYYK